MTHTYDPQTSRKAELFELLVESSDSFAIFTADGSGAITSWNIGAERLFAFAETEAVGSSADLIFTPEDREIGAPEQERYLARRDGRAEDERWHMRKDGSRFWASGLMMPLKDGSGFVKITRDRSEQHATEERLRANEERFRVLATSIPQLVFRTRADGDRTWPSPQWIDFTGISFEESLGQGWLAAIHPEDREATARAWDDARRAGEYYSEQRIRRQHDGEYRWHQTRARPVANDKESDWVGTMTDIHELRTFQDRQQVLMAELQHRTRNLLAVVQAVARQTLRKSVSLESFQTEFEGRLRALSRVQALLARADPIDIDMLSLIKAELQAHADDDMETGKIIIEGPAVSLPADSAQTFALAIHELATNAVKYGALGQATGRLAVLWSIRMEGGQAMVNLEWRESGVTMPDQKPPGRKGYGSELITRALPYQLRAVTTLEFGSDGVRCTIQAPVRIPAQEEARSG